MAYVRRGVGDAATANQQAAMRTLMQPVWRQPYPGEPVDQQQKLLITNLKAQVDGIESALYRHVGNDWNVKTSLRLAGQALEFYSDAIGVALEAAEAKNNAFVVDQIYSQINNLKREFNAVSARVTALRKASQAGQTTLSMPGFAGDLVRLMRGSIAAHENITYLNEIRPFWLQLGLFAKFAGLIDEIWETLAALFDALLQGAKATAGVLAFLLKYAPYVALGVGGFYLWRKGFFTKRTS